ncbi:MAG: YaeQ family protein [Sulfuricella sp.]|nr:YaeQ family protein [Sulfuricella sp.]
MALKATVFKAELGIADMGRNYYASHSLTLARHPSETDERMMVRLLAFALNADEALAFGKGLSSDDEPALWRINLDGTIALWIEVGLPDEKELRKACGRAKQVAVYLYGGRVADMWWSQNQGKLARLDNLSVTLLPVEATQALAGLVNRTMKLDCTVQEGQVWLSDGSQTVPVEPAILQAPR